MNPAYPMVRGTGRDSTLTPDCHESRTPLWLSSSGESDDFLIFSLDTRLNLSRCNNSYLIMAERGTSHLRRAGKPPPEN
jgi:hypothetical protein